jgi:hypothetical protein
VLRLRFDPQAMWLQYLASAVVCAWALSYFWPRRRDWDWMRYGNMLLLVSLVAAPYSWVYDGGLAIPALLEGVYVTRSRALLVVLAMASLLVEVQLLSGIKITSPLYLWTTPAWLVWFILARALPRGKSVAAANAH